MIESIRKGNPSILLLDCGSLFAPQVEEGGAELQLKVMERLGYDAMGLGIPELHYGREFLERSRSLVSFPYIASNLLYGGVRPSWVKEYVIKEVGGVKAAILGILDPEEFEHRLGSADEKGFKVTSPREALERLLPEVKGKADIVVLLSQLDETRNRELVGEIPGIDVSVSSGMSGQLMSMMIPQGRVVILNTGIVGTTLGQVTLAFDGQKQPRVRAQERKTLSLGDGVPAQLEIEGLVQTYKKERELRQEKMERELKDGLKLSPQEFMERYRQMQAEQMKGESK